VREGAIEDVRLHADGLDADRDAHDALDAPQ
jgi:hypothetical protein